MAQLLSSYMLDTILEVDFGQPKPLRYAVEIAGPKVHPYFLSQFPLDEIAVMRKDEGHAVFKRPASSKALRQEIEELGAEALIQASLVR